MKIKNNTLTEFYLQSLLNTSYSISFFPISWIAPLNLEFYCVKTFPHNKHLTWLVNQDVVRAMTFFNDMFTESTIRGRRHKYHKKY